jgi:hypothetical protein
MRLAVLAVLILRILLAALAEPIVVEHRQELITRVHALRKRDDVCVGALQGK